MPLARCIGAARRTSGTGQRAGETVHYSDFGGDAGVAAALNSLTQLTLKATMPGVPDFYQGTELWDLSLVDPDNRRPVDFKLRANTFDALETDWRSLCRTWQDARIKFAWTRELLRLPVVHERLARLPVAYLGLERVDLLGLNVRRVRDD